MYKTITFIIITLVALLGMIDPCCYAKEPVQTNQAAKLTDVTLRLKWRHQAQFAGFYYAEKAGFYKEAGLNVIIEPVGSEFSAIPPVVDGGDDFGISSPDQLLLAREEGLPVVAVAVIYQQTPAVIASLRESNITKLEDLIGKKIGVIYGGDDELIYRAELRAANIDSKKIIEEPIRYDLSVLLNKNVDAILAYRTNAVPHLIAMGKALNLIYPADYGINFYSDTLFTTEKMIKEHPQLVRKFVRASLKGWQEALKHPQKAIEYSLQYMMYDEAASSDYTVQNMQFDATAAQQLEAAKFAASLPLVKVGNIPIGSMQKSVWDSMQNLLLHFGLMRKRLDVSRVFTTEFLK